MSKEGVNGSGSNGTNGSSSSSMGRVGGVIGGGAVGGAGMAAVSVSEYGGAAVGMKLTLEDSYYQPSTDLSITPPIFPVMGAGSR